MTADTRHPRIAFIAGTLAQGGAEKQLLYMARVLLESGADVRVYSLTRGELHEQELRAMGVDPIWVGRFGSPPARVAAVAAALRDFRPHILQSAHFYTNLYAALVAPLYGAVGIGTVRSDVEHEMRTNGRWGRSLLRAPAALILNSEAACRNALALGVHADRLHVLPNAIDLDEFDQRSAAGPVPGLDGAAPIAIGVGSFVPAKRFDRFLRAIALARASGSDVRGVLVGDGPERSALEELAGALGLLPDAVWFAGRRNDVPALLRGSQLYVLTSGHEGFPNVLLEAMAARLPVVATPAGDAGVIVHDGASGFIVPHDDERALAARMVELAGSRELRTRLGEAGRARVEASYGCDAMRGRLIAIHRAIAERLRNRRSLAALADC